MFYVTNVHVIDHISDWQPSDVICTYCLIYDQTSSFMLIVKQFHFRWFLTVSEKMLCICLSHNFKFSVYRLCQHLHLGKMVPEACSDLCNLLYCISLFSAEFFNWIFESQVRSMIVLLCQVWIVSVVECTAVMMVIIAIDYPHKSTFCLSCVSYVLVHLSLHNLYTQLTYMLTYSWNLKNHTKMEASWIKSFNIFMYYQNPRLLRGF